MLSFIELGRLGRLGNQLFQYAALRGAGVKTGYEIKIPEPARRHWQGQDCLLGEFNLEVDYLQDADMQLLTHRYVEPTANHFHPRTFELSDGTDLYGFFQSYRYFAHCEEQIRREFQLPQQICDEAATQLTKVRESGDRDAEVVSVHMRRGDNTDGTNPEYVNFYGQNDVLTPESDYGRYFYKALEMFEGKRVKYLVFSGGSRRGGDGNLTDIEWCKKNFNGDNVYYAEGNRDLVDFSLMSQCHHNIACHMTSFGWWAAFLNNNPGKIVVTPENYTVPDDGRQHYGFYPPSWRTIDGN
tara:strand:- start:2216 stop:3109 length:894 start_codon:yes stop_codon:yes gene_type:complete